MNLRNLVSRAALACIVGGCLLGSGATAAEPVADHAPTFTCHAWFHDNVCHFSILKPDGSRYDFSLTSGETKPIDAAAAGQDRYMVSIDQPVPTRASDCGRVKRVWCKMAPVSAGSNM